MPALNRSQKRPTNRDSAVERHKQKLNTFAENSAWALSGGNRLEEFDFERDDLKNDEKLEKNSYLDYHKYVNLREEVIAILKSGKSDDEKADLLVAVIGPSPNNDISSQNKIDFKAAAKVDPGPLPENPVRYADRKAHPQYANLNAVEFLRAVWGKWIDSPGAVYQDDIGKKDDTLIPNVRSHCDRKKLVAKDFLPPPRQMRATEGAKADPTGRSLRALEAKRRADLAYKRNSLHSIPKTY